MIKACEHCGEDFEYSIRPGRTPRYCSRSCQGKAYRARRAARTPQVEIPWKMRQMRRWVRCDERKRPVSPSGALLFWHSEASWMTYEEAAVADYGAGLGFITGEGVGVIDLDDCLDEDGSLSDLAMVILRWNAGAYAEVSQSGHGLHIFGSIVGDVGIRSGGLEVYAGDRKRFIWVTGDTYQAGDLPKLRW